MIPKIIHMCWLSGDAYPEQVQKCLDSWKKNLPDYEIRIWDRNSFDFNSIFWTRQAIECRKYAFASDFIRFYALYNYGGIYLDSDVEVLKSFDAFLNQKFFFGYEYSGLPEAAVIGSEPGMDFINSMLEWYMTRPFINEDGSCNAVVAPLVVKYFFEKETSFDLCDDEKVHSVAGGTVFTHDYFSPKNCFSKKSDPVRKNITENTAAIHHFNSGWIKKGFSVRIKRMIHLALIFILGKKKYNRFMHSHRKPLKSVKAF